MTEEQVICSNCILPNGFLGINVDFHGKCDFCRDPTHKNLNWSKTIVDEVLKKEYIEEWNSLIKYMRKIQETQKYACVLAYSGGKDSTALLDTLVNEYKIKPFLITIDTGFMTDVAKNNIKDTLTKMDLYGDHIFIEAAIPTFLKLYQHYFLNHSSNKKALTIDICHTCTDLIHTIVVKEAMKLDIPFVLIGFSPDQINRYFYKTSKREILKDGTPKTGLRKELKKSEMKWFLDPNEIDIGKIPEVIYPYHIMKYDEKEIIARIESKGLIEVGKGDPSLTNCHIVKAALMYDLYRYGGLTYALQYAELVRQESNEKERIKSRKDWLRLYNQIARSIFNNTFNTNGMQLFFEKIGVSREKLIEIIKQHRKNDSNMDQILKNIELVKTRKLK